MKGQMRQRIYKSENTETNSKIKREKEKTSHWPCKHPQVSDEQLFPNETSLGDSYSDPNETEYSRCGRVDIGGFKRGTKV